jgi:uncharacterized protein (TIGR03118 family)
MKLQSHMLTEKKDDWMKLEKLVVGFGGVLALSLLPLRPTVFAQRYIQTNLVSSIPGVGTNPTNPQDAQLINSWGLARSTTSPWWIADNGTGVATIYNGAGTKQGLVVTIPPPMGGSPPSAPTGVVFNGTSDFMLGGSPAIFIFVTEDGTIAAWNGGTTATIVATKKNAVYKGCTIGEVEGVGTHYLYVANFHSGKIEVYDSSFKEVTLSPTAFAVTVRGTNPDQDRLAPFNVQAIGTNLYVTYAKQDDMKHDDVKGPGLGAVVVFDTLGQRLARLQGGDWFNAPWGIALAPGEFGEFSHSLLVGMFGSGQIAAFNPVNGRFLRLMVNPDFSTLTIDGLWAIGFGAGNANSGPYNTLFFTAGPNDEHDGLFGTLVADPSELAEADEP